MAELLNFWKKITIYCNNHASPLPMEVLRNDAMIKSPFYACANYRPPKESGTVPCANRLNLDDYQGIVLKFSDIVASDDGITDFTNYTFSYKGGRYKYRIKVLLYEDNEIRLGILNTSIIVK